ncbi:hypothetical protein DQ04_00601250 [Trypanosoma grayi]|uniref:hypothetical protein n=1 Tax=Trypanosoma grayi TaxID=71804 RepID=UPI0004F49D3A|nr:hypothetical protein DQ04_00601250 [Trypanosoma grayi]KEG14158.1 hypothetical protein DQ04_00601250 [Trypanosoma grayi]
MQRTSEITMKVAGAIAVATAVGFLVRAWLRRSNKVDGSDKANCGGYHGKQKKCPIRPVEKIEGRGFTRNELQEYDGVRKSDIYVSVKRVVYEVAPQFYGPGKPYHIYAGREISRCLAKADLTGKEADKHWVPGCKDEEIAQLEEWVKRFESKYPVMGWYLPDKEFFSSVGAVEDDAE